jgi:hypothetical protein
LGSRATLMLGGTFKTAGYLMMAGTIEGWLPRNHLFAALSGRAGTALHSRVSGWLHIHMGWHSHSRVSGWLHKDMDHTGCHQLVFALQGLLGCSLPGVSGWLRWTVPAVVRTILAVVKWCFDSKITW